MINGIETFLKGNKKVLIFLNRRWEAWALICKDCSHQIECTDCNIPFSVHKFPSELLICHNCNKTEKIPTICPNCKSTNLNKIWTWTQKIEQLISGIFKDKKITRLDSDKLKKEWLDIRDIKNSDIIIATEIVNSISFDDLWLVIFPLFELELTIWEYDIEEKIYTNITHNIKRWAQVIIQTFIPKNPLLKIITEGNYKDFLMSTLEERKKFSYPPYKELLYIFVKWDNKEKLIQNTQILISKISTFDEWKKLNISYNPTYFWKTAWIYFQKIIIKWETIEDILKPLKNEIWRNRNINLEWK